MTRPPIWQLLDALQMDLRDAQAKLTSLRSIVAGMAIEDRPSLTCPECQLPFPGPRTLAEHRYHAHNGPEPDHWARTDEQAQDPEPALD